MTTHAKTPLEMVYEIDARHSVSIDESNNICITTTNHVGNLQDLLTVTNVDALVRGLQTAQTLVAVAELAEFKEN